MAYIVNVNDPTAPTGPQGATQGAEELRALKAALLAVTVAASAGAMPRQVIVDAVLDSSGYNAALTVGTGLRPGLTASPTDPYQLSYAAGFSGGKAINSEEAISANNADILGADLPLSNTSYLYRTFGAAYGSCLIPPQEGYAFDRTKGSLLNFDGADGAVAALDDFGNTWAFSGNAQLDTAQKKFGTASLLLDGTGDFIKSTNFTSFGDGSWEVACWFRLNATSAVHLLWAGLNAIPVGFILSIDHNAGNRRIRIDASSDGTTNNIASAITGSTITIALATWYRVRAVFDALAGTYRVYLSNNGAAETQELSVSSALKVCGITNVTIGEATSGLIAFNGWIDDWRYLPCATKTALETPAAVAATITEHKTHFFSIPKMKMYEVTAASTAAGANPTLTAATRLFLGDADTSGAAVTAIRNYAIQAKYESPLLAAQAATTNVDYVTNLGVDQKHQEHELYAVVRTIFSTNNVVGEVVPLVALYIAALPYGTFHPVRSKTRNSVRITSMGGGLNFLIDNTYTAIDGKIVMFLVSKRNW